MASEQAAQIHSWFTDLESKVRAGRQALETIWPELAEIAPVAVQAADALGAGPQVEEAATEGERIAKDAEEVGTAVVKGAATAAEIAGKLL